VAGWLDLRTSHESPFDKRTAIDKWGIGRGLVKHLGAFRIKFKSGDFALNDDMFVFMIGIHFIACNSYFYPSPGRNLVDYEMDLNAIRFIPCLRGAIEYH
jgi:hypothetical protein